MAAMKALLDFFLALGLALSLAYNVMLLERASSHAGTLAHCLNGGHFTAGSRVINCVVVDTHQGK